MAVAGGMAGAGEWQALENAGTENGGCGGAEEWLPAGIRWGIGKISQHCPSRSGE
jgi:hypothetical protein